VFRLSIWCVPSEKPVTDDPSAGIRNANRRIIKLCVFCNKRPMNALSHGQQRKVSVDSRRTCVPASGGAILGISVVTGDLEAPEMERKSLVMGIKMAEDMRERVGYGGRSRREQPRCSEYVLYFGQEEVSLKGGLFQGHINGIRRP
jgi:hypothetical protein